MSFLKQHKYNIFIVLSFTLLTISYSTNIFHITDNNYKGFDKADEGNVLGRMFYSREHGIFYKGGITGQYGNYKYRNPQDQEALKSDHPLSQLYNNYINDREIYGGSMHFYRTQPGGHAMLYSFLQMISPFSGKINFGFFRFLTIALSALAFALFAGWGYRNFGLIAGCTTFILIFLSPWFFRFAFNLWWALWSFYIPFLTTLLVLERRLKKGVKLFDNKLILYLCIALYIKFFFTGAEFITSTLVAAVSPIIYYLLLDKERVKEKLIYFVKSSIAACFTIVLCLLQLVVQIRYCDGSWSAGFQHVLFSYTKHDTQAVWMQDSSRLELIWKYLKFGDVFKWDFLPIIDWGFGILIIIISICSIYTYLSKKVVTLETYQKYRSIVLTTAISIIGPLSWLIFFPAHASFHDFLDYIIWYMPYALLGFIVIGISLNIIITSLKKKLIKDIQLTHD